MNVIYYVWQVLQHHPPPLGIRKLVSESLEIMSPYRRLRQRSTHDHHHHHHFFDIKHDDERCQISFVLP